MAYLPMLVMNPRLDHLNAPLLAVVTLPARRSSVGPPLIVCEVFVGLPWPAALRGLLRQRRRVARL